MSRQTTIQRHRTLRLVAVGVVALGVVAVAVMTVFNVVSGGGSAAPATWSAASYSGGPRLAVDRTLVDEGSVPYNHEVNATYRVKNVGDQSLTLETPTVDVVEGC